MALQGYTAAMKVLETLNCTVFRPKSILTINREFELLLGDSREISA
jgi:hypothetical protein